MTREDLLVVEMLVQKLQEADLTGVETRIIVKQLKRLIVVPDFAIHQAVLTEDDEQGMVTGRVLVATGVHYLVKFGGRTKTYREDSLRAYEPTS